MELLALGARDEAPELEPLYEEIYDERNFNMAARIEEFLTDDEPCFVVVGAGHLVGDNGLVSLLTERGYTVEQLYDND